MKCFDDNIIKLVTWCESNSVVLCVACLLMNACIAANFSWPVFYIDILLDCKYPFVVLAADSHVFHCQLYFFSACHRKILLAVFILISGAQPNQKSDFKGSFFITICWNIFVYNYVNVGLDFNPELATCVFEISVLFLDLIQSLFSLSFLFF